MIEITVPATSANIGSGFDSIGLALSLSNRVRMELCEGLDISCDTGQMLPRSERNLVYSSAKKVFQICEKTLPGLRIIESSHIPMTRGLGSSSASVVAGLLGANALLNEPLTQGELINLAADIEGHPDNTTPAILGGFVAALLEDGKVWYVRIPLAEGLLFAAFIPDFKLPTAKARRILPAQVSRADAIYNLSRAALLTGSLMAGELHNIDMATRDRLHQPYRMPLIPGGEALMALALHHGAHGVYLSGAGPTLIAITDDNDYGTRVQSELGTRFPGWRLQMLQCDPTGAVAKILI